MVGYLRDDRQGGHRAPPGHELGNEAEVERGDGCTGGCPSRHSAPAARAAANGSSPRTSAHAVDGAPLSTAAAAHARSRFEPMAWDEADGKLVRVVKKGNFAEALAYVNRVGAVAEARNHHPDIEISWDTVTLRLWSHNAGQVTDADRDLAAAIDALDAPNPPEAPDTPGGA